MLWIIGSNHESLSAFGVKESWPFCYEHVFPCGLGPTAPRRVFLSLTQYVLPSSTLNRLESGVLRINSKSHIVLLCIEKWAPRSVDHSGYSDSTKVTLGKCFNSVHIGTCVELMISQITSCPMATIHSRRTGGKLNSIRFTDGIGRHCRSWNWSWYIWTRLMMGQAAIAEETADRKSHRQTASLTTYPLSSIIIIVNPDHVQR